MLPSRPLLSQSMLSSVLPEMPSSTEPAVISLRTFLRLGSYNSLPLCCPHPGAHKYFVSLSASSANLNPRTHPVCPPARHSVSSFVLQLSPAPQAQEIAAAAAPCLPSAQVRSSNDTACKTDFNPGLKMPIPMTSASSNSQRSLQCEFLQRFCSATHHSTGLDTVLPRLQLAREGHQGPSVA